MKTFLITGASRGIGFQLSKQLADQGNNVIATARTETALQKLKSENPEHIKMQCADLSSMDDILNLTTYLDEIDGLVFNAGALINKPFTELSDSDWKQMLDVNLMAAVRLIRSLIPKLKENSHIVLISSMGGYQGSSKFPGLSAYSASKGALSILAECLAAELQEQRISVNALCLGAVQTEMLENAFPGFQAPVSASEMGAYISHFLIEGNRYYNGKVLPVSLADPK